MQVSVLEDFLASGSRLPVAGAGWPRKKGLQGLLIRRSGLGTRRQLSRPHCHKVHSLGSIMLSPLGKARFGSPKEVRPELGR